MGDDCCRPKATIACSLSAAELGERQQRFRELAARHLVRREIATGEAVFEFRDGRGGEVERAVRELARLEKECCPFFEISVSSDGGVVRLRVSAPEEGRGAVDAFYDFIAPDAVS